jgi:hypothetical protein
VTINGAGFVCFARDELGIIGVLASGEPQRFSDRYEAFDAAVKRRIQARHGPRTANLVARSNKLREWFPLLTFWRVPTMKPSPMHSGIPCVGVLPSEPGRTPRDVAAFAN